MKSTVSLLILIFTVMPFSTSLNPGFQTRVTARGMNYAAQVATDVLATTVKRAKIPDVQGSAHHLKYSISNIQIISFQKPESNVVPQPAKGLTWTARNLGISIRGDFRYKYKKIISISDHGRLDVSASGVTFSLSVAMGVDKSGRPSIKSTGCSCDIHKIDLKFHSKVAWLYKLVSGLFKGDVTRELQKVVCSSVQKSIDESGEKSLSKLPVTVDIDHKFLLDYRLLSAPSFTSAFMDTQHKGEVYWSAAVTEAPFPPPAIPAPNNSSKMLYFVASDYLVNTMAYVAHQHGVLKKNLTAKDLPADKRSFLNTTCHGFSLCFGSLIPKAKEMYPDSQAELHMMSDRPPRMTISPKEITVNFGGNVAFWARLANNSNYFMFSVNVTLNTSLTTWVKNELVYGKIDGMNLAVKLDKSKIGSVSDKILQKLLNGAIQMYVIPQLNKLGEKGFPLPVTDQVKFTNTQLLLLKDAMMLGTDLTYAPKSVPPRPKNEFKVIPGNDVNKDHSSKMK